MKTDKKDETEKKTVHSIRQCFWDYAASVKTDAPVEMDLSELKDKKK